MKLLEDRAKRLFADHGIPVPKGITVASLEDLPDITYPSMVKALVPVGGRGKAGGVARVSTTEEARAAAGRILGMDIAGNRVRSVRIEEALDIDRELYLSVTVDRSSGLPLLMATGQGGMEVESLSDSSISRWTVHPFLGMESHLGRDVARALGLKERTKDVQEFLQKVWELFWTMDGELVEINPLVLTTDGRLVAADAKVTVNDDALFRHPELVAEDFMLDELEAEAHRNAIAFVRLDGDIGVIANGAGLTMATLDELALHGGRGGAFLDLGGTDDPAKVEKAFEIMTRAGPRTILINIFGGITKCDTVAEGVLRAMDVTKVDVPVVARIRGVNEEKARAMLQGRGIAAFTSLEDAVKDAVHRRERA